MSGLEWFLIGERMARRCQGAGRISVHQGDQLTAYVRDWLDTVGVNVADETAVHGVATGLCMGEAAIANAHRLGQVSTLTFQEVKRRTDCLLTGLAPYMPAEVTR